jgi:hypothetical protein
MLGIAISQIISVILNQIAEHKSFGNCVFKTCDLKLQVRWCFFKNADNKLKANLWF